MKYRPRFINDLVMKDNGDRTFTLVRFLTYVSDIEVTGQEYNRGGTLPLATLVVPVGFKTDLASIPRGLWNLLPPIGRYDEGAVVHDYLYQQPPGAPKVQRHEADAVLLEAMKVCGVGCVARWMIYAGVRVGGWVTWNRYRARSK